MKIRVVYICRNCHGEIIREYETGDNPREFVRKLACGEECPAPSAEMIRYREQEVDPRAPAAPPCRIHQCGEKTIGVLEVSSISW